MTEKMTAREAQVLEWVQKAQSNKVIARQLNISENTVKMHIGKLLKKQGVRNRTQLAMYSSQGATVELLPVSLEQEPVAWVEMPNTTITAISLKVKEGWYPVYLRKK